jgi:hypothetical protein
MAGRIAYLGNIVTQGLVLDLDAGIKGSYPGVGTTWTDISNNSNNGTLTNGPTFTSADYGAIRFDGVDDYVDVTNTADNLPNFTVGCWFKTTVTTSGLPAMLVNKLVNYSNGAGWGLFQVNGDVRFIFQTNGSLWGVYYTTGQLINDGTWHSATAVLSNGLLNRIYINGTPVGTTLVQGTPWTTYSNSGNIRIGTAQNNQYFFSGSIGNTQIYNQFLTQFQVWQNFNSYKVRYGIPDIVTDGLVLNLDAGNPYSYLSGSSGTTWTNTVAVSSSISGTLVNGPVYSNGAITFDGADDYIDCSNIIGNFGTSNFTLSAWVKTTSTSRSILAKQVTNGWNGFNFYINSNGKLQPTVDWSTSAQFGYIISNTSINTGTWTYCVFVFNGTTKSDWRIYINGVSDSFTEAGSAITGTGINNSTLFTIAKREFSEGTLGGNISSVQIYNRALSATEVQQNFNALRGRYGI